MRFAMLILVLTVSAVGQSTKCQTTTGTILDANISAMLEGHGIRSAILVTGNYEMFERAAAKIPNATAAMEQALVRAKRNGEEDLAERIEIFHAAVFDLRYFHYRTTEAMGTLRSEMKYSAGGEYAPLSGAETDMANRYLERTMKNLEHDFAMAMARWEKTARHVGRYLDHHHL